MIPLPFARATLRIASLMAVPPNAGDAQREQKRLEVEKALRSLSG